MFRLVIELPKWNDVKIGKLLVACEGYEPKKMQSSANIIETQIAEWGKDLQLVVAYLFEPFPTFVPNNVGSR